MKPIIWLFPLLLVGCSTSGLPGGDDFWGWNPQNYQGCTVAKYRDEEGAQLTWWDCKDKSTVVAKVDLPNGGTLEYSAADVKGLDRAAIRAKVEEAANAAGVEFTSDFASKLVDALVGL